MTDADIRECARSYFESGMSPAHDWQHVERVETLAERLLAELPAADERVVELGVLLHDVGRAREDRGEIDDHAAWGARESHQILDEFGVDAATIDAVVHCVSAHRYSTDPEPDTLEAQLLSDADNLDALGAVGVARCFTYGGEHGEAMYDPDLLPDDDPTDAGRTQFNHFHKKILDLPERMYTDPGRRLAEDRAAFVRTFLERFEQEVAGER